MNRICVTQAIYLLIAIVTIGCEQISKFISELPLDQLRISDAVTEPPETIDILCDASEGSTCNEDTLRETLDSVFQHSVSRPGSKVRLWNLGANLSQTIVVAETVSPNPVKKQKHKSKPSTWPKENIDCFITAIQAEWILPPPKQTPLAESLTKIGKMDSCGLFRRIIVLTDAREYRLGNFECHPPSIERWRHLLKENGALTLDSLKDVEVSFVNVSMPAVRGCNLSLSRENRVHELWNTAMKDAGAIFSITSGSVRLNNQTKTSSIGSDRR